MNKFLGNTENQLNKILNNQYVVPLLAVFLSMYGPRLSPKLPHFIKNLFKNSVFNFIVILLVIYLSNKNLQLSFLISIAFLLIISLVNSQELFDNHNKKKLNIL